MGNCQSAKHHAHAHVPVLDDLDVKGNSSSGAKSNNNKYNNSIRGGGGGDVTDSTESERDHTETNTLPLTPLSNDDDASSQECNSNNKEHSPKVEKETLSALSSSPPKVSSPSSRHNKSKIDLLVSPSTASWSSPHPQHQQRTHGRALKARLEKSRSIQASFSRQSLEGASAASNDWSKAGDDASSSSAANSLYRYSLVSHDDGAPTTSSVDGTTTTASNTEELRQDNDYHDDTNKLKNEFDASIAQGTVWAEYVLDNQNQHQNDKALAVTLSRQTPTLSQPNPPLFLGVGTEHGTVSVVELLDDSSLSSSSSPSSLSPSRRMGVAPQQQQYRRRRLGKTLHFQCEGRVRSLDFSPDGQYLAVGGDDCICTVLRLVYNNNNNSKGSLAQLQICAELERVDRVFAIKFSPDGKYLAVGGYDGAVAIAATQDIAESYTPDLVAEISSDGLVFCLDWSSPDDSGQYLAFGGSDRVCSIVHSTTSWRVVHRIRRPAVIKTLAWNAFDKRLLAIGSSNVVIVSAPDFTVHEELEIPRTVGSSGSGSSSTFVGRTVARINSLCWSPNGSYLVVCDSTNKCRVMETKSFATVQEIKRSGDINAVHWGQQAVIGGIPRRYLVIGDNDKVALLKAGLEMNDGASAFGDELCSSMASSFYSTSTREDGPMGRSSEWVLQENAFRDMDCDVAFSVPNPETTTKVLAVTFSRGSRSKASTYFAYSTDDGLVTVKSPNGWKTVAELRFPQPVTTLFFSNGSRYLAFGCQDSKVYISGTAPRWSLLATTQLSSPPRAISFSKDNQFLAAGCDDGTFVLLDSRKHYQITGTLDNSTVGQSSAVTALDWCSKILAIARDNGMVQLYDTNKVTSGCYVSVAEIKRHSPIRSIAFGLSGRFLAVGTNDGIVGVYSAKGGWVLCHQLRLNAGVTSLRWSPTCSFLAVSNSKEELKVLDTVFWQNVEEASQAFSSGQAATSTIPPKSCLGPSCMCFSQNGKHLALAKSQSGLTVVDATDWKISFTLNDERHKDSDSTSYSSFDIPEEHSVD